MQATLADSPRQADTMRTSIGAGHRESIRPVYQPTRRGLELLSVLNEVFDRAHAEIAHDDAEPESQGD
jgi:hypothetical protein